MAIGSLGEIIFEASSERVRTIDNVRRKGAARWATHDVVGRKPSREFIGPGLESICFTMQFSVSHGVNPEDELKKLRKMRDEGKAASLILGGSPVGEGLWTIEDMAESHKKHDNKGAILFADVEINLMEYPKNDDAQTSAIPSGGDNGEVS